MRRPSFQFFPADWRANTKLRRCSHAERGIWLEVMCLLHDSDEYGLLRWPLADIAQAIGCRVSDLQSLRAKGVLKGADAGERCAAYVHVGYHARQPLPPVTLVAEQEGPVWYSSRMVRDEYLRQRRGASTRFGEERQPDLSPSRSPDNAPSHSPTQRQGEGPSSSSSSSLKTKPNVPLSEDGLFALFWAAYPRKVKKPAALKAWSRANIDDTLLATLLAAIEQLRRSKEWQKDDGAYIPYPASWLNQRRWEDEPFTSPALTSPTSSDGHCGCGELGVVRANNGAWLCSRHREAA